VDPQPDGRGLRAGAPSHLRVLASLASVRSDDNKTFRLEYQVGGQKGQVNYAINADGSMKFDFVDIDGKSRMETYTAQGQGGGRRSGEKAAKEVVDHREMSAK